jgi:hypothetical protein
LEEIVDCIRRAFAETRRPPDAFLVGSTEGCEPEEEVGPFRGRDWQSLEPEFLDLHYCALSFFSEGALRYFLPAFMIADVRQQLKTADPVFMLTHGFHAWTSNLEMAGRTWTRRYGPAVLLNPIRYGAMTLGDYARFRLSVFTREEAAGIVEYLRHAAERDPDTSRPAVDDALQQFWLDRAQHAPAAAAVAEHQREEEAFGAAVRAKHTPRPPEREL